MTSVALEDMENGLAALARRAEAGETILVTCGGRPIAQIVPHRREGGIDWEAGEAYLLSIGIARHAGFIAPDFDDPLSEDFLIRSDPGAWSCSSTRTSFLPSR